MADDKVKLVATGGSVVVDGKVVEEGEEFEVLPDAADALVEEGNAAKPSSKAAKQAKSDDDK
jgi:hypothetical protein